MQRLHPHKTGLIVGAFFGCAHLLWSVFVALGWAETIIAFVFRLHFITMPFQVEAFGAGRALGLVLFTAAIGYVGGYAVAAIWNYVHRNS